MKMRVVLHLDLPAGEVDHLSDAEMSQMLFDTIQNRLTVSYLEAVVHAHVDPKVSSEEQRVQTLQHYDTWADIIANAILEWKREES